MIDRVFQVRVSGSAAARWLYVTVEVGPWDPDRFRRSGDDTDVGGFRFGGSASVRADVGWEPNSDPNVETFVSIGGIGEHPAAVALERAETYRYAAEIAYLLADRIGEIYVASTDRTPEEIRDLVAAAVAFRFPTLRKIEP